MDGEQEDGAPRDASASASPPPATTQATDSSGDSIFHFHPHHQQQEQPLQLKKKAAATPHATTPRNLVFPEPSDVQNELPAAQERAYTDLRDGHNGGGNVHQHVKVPPSAKKNLSPRTGDDQEASDSLCQQKLELKKKATPRATTPRNLVFPEPSDVQNELSVAQELPYTDLRDNHNGDADQEVHRRIKVPPSAKKYLSPRTGEDGGDLDDGRSLPSADGHRHHSRHHHHKGPQTVTPVVPRSLHGKLTFYGSRSVQRAWQSLRSVRQIYCHLSFQQKSAFGLILAGMLSESATPAPRYNVPIGIGVFMTSMSRFDHRMVVSGLCLAILIDFAWLLRPQEGAFNGFFQVNYDNLMHASLAICTLVKVWLVFFTYFDLGPEPPPLAAATSAPEDPSVDPQQPPPHHPVWHHIKFFFPRKTLPRSSHLSFEVLMRTLALIWIHGLCGVALFVLGILSAMFYTDRVQFRSMAFGAPLHLMMLFRSATTLASYVVATQHMNYNGCLKLFGCHKLAEYDDDGGADIVLKYNKRWLQRVQRAKALDTVVGVYFLLVFYAAFHSGQFFSGSGLTAVLIITALIVLVLDFWTPLLLMVIAKCGAVLHAHHKRGTVDVDPYYPNQLEWEEQEDDGKDGDDDDSPPGDDSSSSSSDSSSSGESSSYSSSWSSSGSRSSSGDGYSATDSRIRRRRQRRQRHRQKKMSKRLKKRSSSRKPLLRTENSLPIVNADEVHSGRGSAVGVEQLRANSINSSRVSESRGGGVWVRHWHEASGRSFLVHSITGESVWEIVSVQKTTGNSLSSMRKFPSSSALTVQAPRAAAGYPGSGGLSSARRQSSDTGTISSPPVLVVPGSPPTSDSEIVVTSVHSPRGGGGSGSARLSARRFSSSPHAVPIASESGDELLPPEEAATDPNQANELLLTADEFLQLWDALPDGGSFICRVSKIPSPPDLARHLHRHRFLISSDGLNRANLRTMHFYAAVVGASPHDDSHLPQFFLGEFVFDSLSLKLYAKFRCPQQDAIVPCVKKLQLKEIVGSYARCE
ncbi:hypothetical protein Gpo141_00009988 [Globisporangium polare]